MKPKLRTTTAPSPPDKHQQPAPSTAPQRPRLHQPHQLRSPRHPRDIMTPTGASNPQSHINAQGRIVRGARRHGFIPETQVLPHTPPPGPANPNMANHGLHLGNDSTSNVGAIKAAGRATSMLANEKSTVMHRLKTEFNALGYVGRLLREDYLFADFLGKNYRTKRIPLAAFAQEPPSYRNAAFGVTLANGQSGAPPVRDHRSLGAPQILEVASSEIRRWKIGTGEPERLDTIALDGIPEFFAANRSDWLPRTILRAKSSRTVAIQLDFLDYDLLPLLDHEVRIKLDDLLRHTIKLAIAKYEEHSQFRQDDYPPLFRLVFRLIAAKILADRGEPGDWTSSDARTAIQAVETFYFKNDGRDEALLDSQTQNVIWKQIRSAFHFQNLSVDSLAHVYENTMITKETRKLFGIHSTPREIAEYIVRRLPFEALDVADRRVFEPFSGHSVFLVAAMQRLRELLPAEVNSEERHRYFVEMLSGIELDDFAREVAKLSLMLADYPNPDGWRLIGADAFGSVNFEKELHRASIVLCNPPFERLDAIEQARYGKDGAIPKPAEILSRVLEHPPALLGFVLPRAFLTGRRYGALRMRLRETYSSVELLLLPDHVFRHSAAETVLLIASGVGAETSRLRTAEVDKTDLTKFYRSGYVSFVEEASGDLARREDRWHPQRLRGVWEATTSMDQLGDLATIHRGIEYNVAFDRNRADLVATVARRGFQMGIHKTDDSIEPFFVMSSVFLNTLPELLKGTAIEHPWAEPKLIVNTARRSRGPWSLTAAIDMSGLVCYQNAHGVWPDPEFAIELAAAVLNGPVANAYIDEFEGKRDVRIVTLKDIPVPRFEGTMRETIVSLVKEYQRCRYRWSSGEMRADRALRLCNRLLRLIDLLVLRAYDLPPNIERQLLAHFTGCKRIGPVKTGLVGVTTVDADIRGILEETEMLNEGDGQRSLSEALDVALYRYGSVVVDLLRQYWKEGYLQGEMLVDTLEHLGRVHDWPSRLERHAILVDALSVADSEIRYAAAKGLLLMGDDRALNSLKLAKERERNPVVRTLIQEAMTYSQTMA